MEGKHLQINTEMPLDSSKNEHLILGEKPTMVCLGLPEDRRLKKNILRLWQGKIVLGVDNIDFEGNILISKLKNFKSGGPDSYVISGINERDKFSEGIFDCTGLVAIGRDKITHKNISFATHQNPYETLSSRWNTKAKEHRFERDITAQLSKLKERSGVGTVDVIIIGGNYVENDLYKENYVNQVDLLTEKTKSIFGFNPVVVGGPKVTGGADAFYIDNRNRRVYLLRPETSQSHPSFTNEQVAEQKKEWIVKPLH